MEHFKNKRNPVLPLEYHVPDSEAHVMPDGKLYIYGSFDDREDVFCSEKYHVISTPDMENNSSVTSSDSLSGEPANRLRRGTDIRISGMRPERDGIYWGECYG